jgi:predicted O-methyltransferase YrrM
MKQIKNNPILENILKTKKINVDNNRTIDVKYNISEEQGKFLQNIIQKIHAKKIIEIGTGMGISSLFILDALNNVKDSKFVTIDPFQSQFYNVGINNIELAGYKKLTKFYRIPSYLALPQLQQDNVTFDFAFIDGYHLFDYALTDFFYIDKMLKIGGVVAFDDTKFPAVHKVCRYIITNRNYKVYKYYEHKHYNKKVTFKHILFFKILKKLKKFYYLKEDIINPDEKLGFSPFSRCIAFQKIGDDDNYRTEGFHFPF